MYIEIIFKSTVQKIKPVCIKLTLLNCIKLTL